MTSLVLEIQRDAANPEISSSVLLRKMKIIAAKLGIKDIEQWVDSELLGYAGSTLEDLPSYRTTMGDLKCKNPIHGWQPLRGSPEIDTLFSTIHVTDPLPVLETTIANNDSGELMWRLSPEREHNLMNAMNYKTDVAVFTSVAPISAVIEHVKTHILDLALKLEQEGILGEGMAFSPAEKSQDLTIVNHIHARHIGNVASSGHHSTISQEGSSFSDEILTNLTSQVLNQAELLPPNMKGEIMAKCHEIDVLRKEGVSENKGKIRSNLKAIKRIAEGATSNLTAQGIISLIARILSGG